MINSDQNKNLPIITMPELWKDSARVFPKDARSDRSSKKKAGGRGRKPATTLANFLLHLHLQLLLLPPRLIILHLLLPYLLLTILMERL